MKQRNKLKRAAALLASAALLFTGVILWIARRLDGIFENQKHYLLRIHKTEN